MEAGVALPWPSQPAVCPSCQRWVGRGRAVSASDVAARGAGADGAGEPNGRPAAGDPSQARADRPGRPGSPERRLAREGGAAAAPPATAEEASVAQAPPAADDDAPSAAQVAEPQDGAGVVAAEAAPNAASDGAVTDAGTLDGAAHASVDGDAHAPGGASPEQDAADDQSTAVDEPAGDGGPPAQDAALAEPKATEQHTLPFASVDGTTKGRRWLPFLGHREKRATDVPAERGRGGKLMRGLAIALLVIGALLLIEAAVTVLWKEPFSALLTLQGQSKLGDDLKKMEERAAAEAALSHQQMVRYQQRASVKLNRTADPGDPIGRLRIPKTGLNMVVVQSTDEESLKKGPAHYRETPLPGQKGNWSVGIAGHRTTYEAPFRHNDNLKPGNKMVFTLPYGRFTYSVAKTRIVDAGYSRAFVPQGRNMLVLTACHPLYSAAQRILVYGKLIKTEPLGKAKRVARH